uniref:Uncharacterized protein n=1 Tax=Knipowitschia caucasica TaxID=637954 RepID=A0AAV2J7H2_KNICA
MEKARKPLCVHASRWGSNRSRQKPQRSAALSSLSCGGCHCFFWKSHLTELRGAFTYGATHSPQPAAPLPSRQRKGGGGGVHQGDPRGPPDHLLPWVLFIHPSARHQQHFFAQRLTTSVQQQTPPSQDHRFHWLPPSFLPHRSQATTSSAGTLLHAGPHRKNGSPTKACPLR